MCSWSIGLRYQEQLSQTIVCFLVAWSLFKGLGIRGGLAAMRLVEIGTFWCISRLISGNYLTIGRPLWQTGTKSSPLSLRLWVDFICVLDSDAYQIWRDSLVDVGGPLVQVEILFAMIEALHFTLVTRWVGRSFELEICELASASMYKCMVQIVPFVFEFFLWCK